MTEITVIGAGGEYMESVVVVEWHRKLGDPVKAGDLVVTVETAKAATEIEASVDGVLSEIRADVGDEIAVGAVLGVIGDGLATPAPRAVAVESEQSEELAEAVPSPADVSQGDTVRILASPLARRVAAQREVDLSKVKPSSQSGRIRLRDLEAFQDTRAKVSETHQARVRDGSDAALSRHAPATGPGRLNLVNRGNPSGEKVVLLHGFGSDCLSWQPLIAAVGNSVEFILVDLPGHGKSPRPERGSTVHQLAEAVADTLTAAGVDDFHLVGHSLGGAVSLAMAARGRLSIRSLTLLAPAGLGAEIDGGFVSGFARASQVESLTPWIVKLFANPSFASPAFISATMQARTDVNLRDTQSRLAETLFPDGTQAANLRDVVRECLFPQKIIWGEQDRIIPMQHAAGTGGSAGIHYLPGVGHLPHVEAPSIVARLLMQNIRSA